jgi:hypothetical protein
MTTFSNSWFVVDQAVRITPGESGHADFTGQMIELSATAVRLRTDRPLGSGTAVALSWNSTALPAEVRKCIAAQRGFLIEFRLQNAVGPERPNRKAVALSV